jgi:hypothetical protein
VLRHLTLTSDKVIHKEIVKKVKRGVPQWAIERVLGKSVDELEAVKCQVESGWLPSSILKETTESLDEVCDRIRAAFAQPEILKISILYVLGRSNSSVLD